MKYACNYAIARFVPFVETGEFANIGVVLFCLQTKFFDFRLMKRAGKLTTFFDPLESKVYKNAKKDFEKTLVTLRAIFQRELAEGTPQARVLFEELVRPREVLIRFDTPRAILTNDPAQTLDELFNFYVGRDFVTPDYAEKILDRQMSQLLIGANLRDQYKTIDILGGAVKARFPFAHKDPLGKVAKAIKPLHLGHADPAKAYEHGWTWVGKFRQLEKHGALPDKVLIAAQGPQQENREAHEVIEDIRNNLMDLGVKFTNIADTAQIREFAEFR